MRALSIVAGLVVLAAGGLAAAALLAWPETRLEPSPTALAHLSVPRFTGTVEVVRVTTARGARVPVSLRAGEIWPARKLASGQRLNVELTVRRPGWAGWLVGHTEHRTLTVVTPTARLRGRWLQVKPGGPVAVGFTTKVGAVSFGHGRVRSLTPPRSLVPTGVVASGAHAAGSVVVAAAARPWERLGKPVRVTWFPALPYPQLLAKPRLGATIAPERSLELTFSEPVQEVLGTSRPRVTPATSGRWRLVDAHTLVFVPSRFGFGLGAHVHVELPRAVHVAGTRTSTRTSTLAWQVPPGSTLRLQQLLAELGYLPLDWQPASDPVPTPAAELEAAIAPPPGHFTWRYPNTPPELVSQWTPGEVNEITRGAVMMFEDDHDLEVDAIAGPKVWRALIADALAGKRKTDGYSYVFVHRNVPQSLNLWHNGNVILSSPGNTGVPAAPTQLGTFPVFEHIPVGRMSGTNPDGSHYDDPGIQWISYFHGGDAIHAFNRATFGTPQSLGCVELPLAAAAKVWPYTPIGTLVTVEN
jgi:hypothetical protein